MLKKLTSDVNCLLLMKTMYAFQVIIGNIFNKLEKKGINPIVCRWRHRLLGWRKHCITLDLERRAS